jgi:glycosyltransferase involved in cell wall biosynthesis
VHVLDTPARRHALRAAGKLRRIVTQDRIALIHSHLFNANFVAALATLGTDVPWVATRHESLHAIDYAPISLPKRLGYLAVDRIVLRRADTVIAPSHRTENELRELGVRSRRVRRIRHGFDLDRLQREGRDHPTNLDGDPAILAVSRLVALKRIDVLIDAVAKLLPTHPRAHLYIAGEGPLRQTLEEFARRRNVSGSVSLLGQRGDVLALMRAADLLVHASAMETTGMIFLEALAAGCPFIATPVGPVGDDFRDGEQCIVVPHGDSGAVADAIARLYARADQRAQLAEQGWHVVQEKYRLADMVDRYVKLYDDLFPIPQDKAKLPRTPRTS